ncbi:hypothetical protein CLG96_03785 [Sphingomonas oleivorans]|uniref:Aromatic-ring-hydroxylating dioxygenase subunit beta n=1 Tax=Sphingomonas oleivorans TaxID=1735121 RepID=A0A2T5G272_9SPHN|nr:aromatic-ring-hydroxylating dioxygenase subunit beta [Sphingomonas oleivorans]PTQ13249.1 hypothetical protein CLG96_03785 [Sphingomonas oleivorans]
MSLETDGAAIDLHEAIAFIWREAEMLDRCAYAPWLALWSAAGRYVIPIDRGTTDYAGTLNVAYDDQAMREARVKRLKSGFSMSSAPPARTVRTVSRFVETAAEAGAIELDAAMLLVEYKYETTRLLAADLNYRIVRANGGLALDRKVIRLINSDDALHGIGYLL